MKELEFICIESEEFYYNTISRTINGTAHGMFYNGTPYTGILGYSCYDNGKPIKENIFSNGACVVYRYIDNVEYYEDKNCNRMHGNCNHKCYNCQQLDIIQEQIFNADSKLKEIFNCKYDDWRVFVRKPLSTDIISQLHYDIKNLKLHNYY